VFLFIHTGSGTNEQHILFLEKSSVSYTSKIGLSCKKEELDTFESVCANFFMVKMGVAIVVVRFKPAHSYTMNDDSLICPSGGVYSVPPLLNRTGTVPHGVQTALLLLYDVFLADLKKFDKIPSDNTPNPLTLSVVADASTD